ncbi:MAG: dethiobiotin synthetase [Paraglaciecola sp.]|jgi:dethiobiotin synthetase
MKKHTFFVTGTDTEVGKTFISQSLLLAMGANGLTTAAYKPVAAGCEQTPQGLRNEDALLLLAASSIPLTYDEVNPIAFLEPVAPHLAAQNLDQNISLKNIDEGFMRLQLKQADVLLVEGAGGWRLPLGRNSTGEQQYLSDFAIHHKLPVIMVVGMRLGCLNHALLTAEAIRCDGLQLVGWVANRSNGDMPYMNENIQSLKEQLNAPFIGSVPKSDGPEKALENLDLSKLFV